MKNIKRILLTLGTALSCYQATAQLGCPMNKPSANLSKIAATCTQSSTAYNTRYGRASGHIPVVNNTPIKKIRISFHFFQKNDGTGTWINDQAHTDRLNQIMIWITNRMKYLDAPSDPISGVTSQTDSRIEFELTGTYFYQNSYLNNLQTCSSDPYFNYVNSIDPSRIANSIPIFLTVGSYCSGGYAGFSDFPVVQFHSVCVP